MPIRNVDTLEEERYVSGDISWKYYNLFRENILELSMLYVFNQQPTLIKWEDIEQGMKVAKSTASVSFGWLYGNDLKELEIST